MIDLLIGLMVDSLGIQVVDLLVGLLVDLVGPLVDLLVGL